MSSALPRDAREREKQTKKTLAVITLSSSEFRFICVRQRHETMVIITVITLRRLLGFGPCQRSGDRLGGNNECCQAGHPFWQRRSAKGMNGTMARNDITVPLISCQFETPAVFILERLFVFIIGAPPSRRPKGKHSFPLLAQLASQRRHLLLCISRKWHFQNQCTHLFFPPKCVYSGQKWFCECILHREEGDASNRNFLEWCRFKHNSLCRDP